MINIMIKINKSLNDDNCIINKLVKLQYKFDSLNDQFSLLIMILITLLFLLQFRSLHIYIYLYIDHL